MLVAVETVASLWPDMQRLMVEHYHEVAHDKHTIPLCPDRTRYEKMEKSGELLALGARIEGALIGYSAFFVTRHIHYAMTLVGINDVLFVTKEQRKSRAGLLLISESERALRERGVVKAVWHVKPEHDWSALLLRRDYMLVETMYGKLL